MRDLVVIAFYLPLLIYTFAQPFVGVLLWYIVSIGVFHKLAFGFASTLPWAYIVMGVTVFSWIVSREKSKFVWNKPIVMLILWGLWIQVTTVFALNLDGGQPIWEKFMKEWLSTLFISIFLFNRGRILALVAVLAGSIGFYGLKGGLHFALSGTMHASGPPESSLSDNNDFGLACLVILPLLWYLRSVVPKPWQRHAITVVSIFTLLATIATDSRGAFVGLAIVAAIYWWKARGKIRILVGAGVLGALAFALVPQSYIDRMNTIDTYQSDASAENRIAAWEHAIKVANSRPFLGGGMGTFRPVIYRQFDEEVPHAVEAHSIWFQTLGDQGYTGLVLFVAMWVFTYSTARWIRRRTRGDPNLKWAFDLAFYLQISLVSYAACGTFLSQAYLDLYDVLVVIVGMTRYVVEQSLQPVMAGEFAARPQVSAAAAAPAGPFIDVPIPEKGIGPCHAHRRGRT